MKRIVCFTMVCLLCLTTLANKVGVYCFFADNGTHLYEDNNVRLGVAVTSTRELSVIIVNKTDKVLYVDKASSFIYKNGKSESLFHNAAYTSGTTSGRGASVNLGGVTSALGVGGVLGGLLGGTTLGGGSSDINSTTIYEQRVIGLAPNSAQVLQVINMYESINPQVMTVGGVGTVGCEKGKFFTPSMRKGKKFKKGERRNYTEDFTPFSMKASVKYSTVESFPEESSVQATASNFIEHVIIDKYSGVKKLIMENVYLPSCIPYQEKSHFTFRSGGSDIYRFPLDFVTFQALNSTRAIPD